MTMSAIVVEDHAVAREHLRALLADIDGVEWVGDAADGETALRLIRDVRPDLVFLDIEIPGPSGLEVLRRAEPRPLAVFTTAYDQHAVTAFELQALDYVLKPFGLERLRAAVERARALLDRDTADLLERAETAMSTRCPVSRVFVRTRDRIVPVRLDDIEHLRAQGDYVELRDGTRSHLLRVTLQRLLGRLDSDTFVQIHRSHVINLDRVAAFVPLDDGRLRVVLESGETVVASKSRSPALRQRLGSP